MHQRPSIQNKIIWNCYLNFSHQILVTLNLDDITDNSLNSLSFSSADPQGIFNSTPYILRLSVLKFLGNLVVQRMYYIHQISVIPSITSFPWNISHLHNFETLQFISSHVTFWIFPVSSHWFWFIIRLTVHLCTHLMHPICHGIIIICQGIMRVIVYRVPTSFFKCPLHKYVLAYALYFIIFLEYFTIKWTTFWASVPIPFWL